MPIPLAEAPPALLEQMLLFFEEGGFFMVLLGVCSVAGLAAILFKFLSLRRRRILPPELEGRVMQFESRLQEGREGPLLEEFDEGKSALARLSAIAVRHRGRPRAEIAEPVQSAAREEIVHMQAGMTMLDVIITVAPLLGLLGTASGLVVVFSGLEDDADRTQVALGIGRALKTTIVGLAIAVPGIIAQGYFQRRIETFAARLEVLLGRLAQVCEGWREQGAKEAPAPRG